MRLEDLLASLVDTDEIELDNVKIDAGSDINSVC